MTESLQQRLEKVRPTSGDRRQSTGIIGKAEIRQTARKSMKITRVSAYQVDVPIKPATISHDRVMSVFDIT